MDTTLIIIGVVIVIIIIAIIVLVTIGNKQNTTKIEHANQDGSIVQPKDSVATKRIQQVLSDDMFEKEAEENKELLTKYTAGSGDGIPEIEKLLESDPNNVDLLDWLAFMYYCNKNIDKAIETYKKALSIKSDNETQHYYLANSYYLKGMMTEAKREWSEVIRLNPTSKIAKNSQERIESLKSQGK